MGAALLIIDMQRGLFGEMPEPWEAEQVVARVNALAARARASGAPVIWIQHENSSALSHGSEGWQLLRELHAAAGDVFVRKTTPDSFLRTDLGHLLTRRGIDELVICGYATEFCVDTTVRRAAALGYSVRIAADAHTTQDKPHAAAGQIRAHHNATLPEITSFGSRIEAIPSADIGFEVRD